MCLKITTKSAIAFIFSIALFTQSLFLSSEAKFIHREDIHPADLSPAHKNIEPPPSGPPVSSSVIEDLTRQILRKELQLERLNTVFRQQTIQTTNWRQRRMFAYGESNAALTLTGLLLALPPQYEIAEQKTITVKKKTTQPHSTPSQRNNLRAGARMSLIGNSINAGGDLVELGLNYINYLHLRKKGFVPSIYRQNVHRLHGEIDALIDKRQIALASVTNFSSQDAATAQAEGKLLNDLRDLYLLEYIDYHAGCKRFWFAQNAAYLTDLAKNITGGAANVLSLESYHTHRPNLFGTSGLMTIISGGIILLVPFVGRVTGNISGLAARRVASQEATDVHTSSIESYSDDLRNFLAMSSNKPLDTDYIMGLRQRQMLYTDQEKIMLMRNRFVKKEQKDAHNSLVENIVFAGVVGTTKTADGTLITIAGWRYPRKTHTNAQLYAAGTTAYTVGVSFAVLETARLAVGFEWMNWKLRNSDLLPSNQFNRRLRLLDNMDALLGK